uniref:uncharacterized protein LOC122604307 n=1 Tax=Erigeron canadensis TaxID=72917 RepID=UPI001CB969DB|nr:uncharacterized protein LOC122604307 [Erigeron canadensis]
MCPTAWRGMHTRGDIGQPSMILQAVASTDLRIWNAYFGQQGSNNDINVFESLPILEELISGLAPTAPFYANDNYYKAGYYLSDDIYPKYATFVKSLTDPIDDKRKYFKKKQESARKDIGRAFGVLKKRWKDEDKAFCQDFYEHDPTLNEEYWMQEIPMEKRIENSNAVRSRKTHNMLLADLVDHVWENSMRADEEEYVPPTVESYFSDDD